MFNALKLSLALGSGVLLAACSSTPKTVEKPPVAPMAAAPTSQPLPAPISKVERVVVPAHLDPKSPISVNRSVYFDYDVFSIKPEYNNMLEMHGKYLATNPKLSIRVEGNADERGSAEYNLALGQKRAETVVRALKVFGAKDAQLEAISWGEEKPRAAGHTESAYSQNRRADLAYPSK